MGDEQQFPPNIFHHHLQVSLRVRWYLATGDIQLSVIHLSTAAPMHGNTRVTFSLSYALDQTVAAAVAAMPAFIIITTTHSLALI